MWNLLLHWNLLFQVSFKDDGTYTFDTGKSGRGGAYFIVGDKQIALGDGISDFKVYTYKFEGGYNDNK